MRLMNHWFARYGLAAVIALAAVALRLAFVPLMGDSIPYLTIYPAMTLVAVMLGVGPGVLVTVVGLILVEVYLVSPGNSFELSLSFAIRSTILLLTSFYVGWMNERLRQALTQADVVVATGRATEEALRASEERFRALYASMTEGLANHEIVYEDGEAVDYIITDVNPAYERVTGFTRSEAVGRKASELYGNGTPPYLAIYALVAAGSAPEYFETYFPPMEKHFAISVFSPGKGKFATVFSEITARKQTEEHLRFRSHILANITDVVYAMDEHLQLTFWNRAAEKMYGWKEEEVLGRDVVEVVNSTFYLENRDKLSQELVESGLVTTEIEHHTKSGEIVFFESTTILLHDSTGKASGFVSVNHDITERKQAENIQHQLNKTLTQRVDELQTLMDVAPVGIAIGHDSEGQVITVNRLLSEWLGAPAGANVSLGTPEEERQVSYQVLYEGRPARVEELPIQYAALNAKGVRNDEFSIVRSDGRTIEMLANAEPLFDDQGHVRGSIATYIDITERKRAEEHATYQSRLLANVNDAIAGSDAQYRLNAWNASAESMYGWKAEEVLGRNGVELFRTEWPQESAEVMRRIIAETGRWRGEATQLRKDGTRIPVEVSSMVLRDESGQITGYVSVNRDITERKQTEKAMQQMNAELQAVNEDLRTSRMAALNLMQDAVLAGHQIETINQSLQREIAKHKLTEEALSKAHDELELRVQERTQELASVNRKLVQEIAERREVERQLRIQTTAMESAANGILIADPQGIIQWINPALTQMTGYETGELLGQSTRIFNSGEQDVDYYRQMWNTILMGQTWRGETVNRRKDSSLFVEEQIITPVLGEHGQIQHFIAIKQDITERKKSEAELKERSVELQAISAAEHEQRQLSDALVEAALVLNKSMKLDEMLPLILDKIKEVIPYQLANISMLDGKSFYDASHKGDQLWSKALAGIKNRFPPEDLNLLIRMRQSGQPLLIMDTQEESEWVSTNSLEWCRSFLSAPLLAENQVIGFVNLFSEQPGFFSSQMQDRLVAFASHAAVAIQNAWLFEQVRASSDRLQSLSHRLVEIQENERLYIARELHDEAGQMLTSLLLDLRMLETKANQPEAILKKVAEMEVSLNAVSESLHSVAMALRPASLDHLGLVPALHQYVESVGEKYGLKASFSSGNFRDRLPVNMETELYRIVQEALTNVVRHAHATRVDVLLTMRDKKLIVIVEDDGDGFEPQKIQESDHLGLFGMRERADMIGGKLLIESAPGKGAALIVEVDYANSIINSG